jgi:uncharacterized membrane protein
MLAIAQDWLSLFVRWAHIVAAIGWIGSSFYFMALDASLKRRAGMDPRLKGEQWAVHGGGFYHIQKYNVAPENLPEQLHWYRWESYMTWLTGFALLAIVYYWSASTYLLDPAVASLYPWQGVAISMLGLGAGWLFYDVLCKSPLKSRPILMFAVLFVAIVAATRGYGEIFSGRAAFLQIGATIATIMTANVFLVIIPNQRIVVADLKAGRTPDPIYGEIGKLRSTHNNYLTLPVIFLMISNHYPMTFGTPLSFLVVAFVLVLGVVVRDWFNSFEAGATGIHIAWQWPVAVAVAAALALIASLPREGAVTALPEGEVTAARALAIVQTRCASCHAATPTQPGFAAAPGGIELETEADLERHAAAVLKQAVTTHAMPIGNITGMTEEERAELAAWLRAR